jgi:hypothetical protein
LSVRELFAAGSVFLNPYQAQPLFQYADPVLSEFEPLLVEQERSVELFKQGLGKRLFELADQLRFQALQGRKMDAQPVNYN